jgi:hypothetical protein
VGYQTNEYDDKSIVAVELLEQKEITEMVYEQENILFRSIFILFVSFT